ncbi:Phospholipid scramblase 2 [Fragariocoptes setiger]|uniref:Phospholipid scramblase n=1 Tax=Fragariocoptes setiger TaxID=1670756 RepID=A0ABQ7SD73_9ACAR|nr:Phospholipid scramblase 2 [Fragariocoptes setiger]
MNYNVGKEVAVSPPTQVGGPSNAFNVAQPIIQQPGGIISPYGGVPKFNGLEAIDAYFKSVESLRVQQKLDTFEIMLELCVPFFEFSNEYSVENQGGMRLFKANENNNCLTLCCCCAEVRPFDFEMKDLYGNVVLRMDRPLRCDRVEGCCCCIDCLCASCWQELSVKSGDGQVIGKVTQEWSFFKPNLCIRSGTDAPILYIDGPLYPAICCCTGAFTIRDLEGKYVGRIVKEWAGCCKETCTKVDNFNINFPQNLDHKVKATCLGALFLMDYLYYGHPGYYLCL